MIGLDVAAPLLTITGGARTTDVETTTLVAYSIVPESGQGAALRAAEVDTAPAISKVTYGRTTDRGVRVVEGVRVRRLTPRECERLMSWPDDWTAPAGIPAPDTSRYAAIGDGVVANVAEWIGRGLVAADAAIVGSSERNPG